MFETIIGPALTCLIKIPQAFDYLLEDKTLTDRGWRVLDCMFDGEWREFAPLPAVNELRVSIDT